MYREMPDNSIELRYESALIDFGSVDYRGLDRDDNTARLYSLYSRDKNKGHASKLMDYACDIADMYNIHLELSAGHEKECERGYPEEEREKMLSHEELVSFYTRKGFVFNKGSIRGERKPNPKPINCDESISRFFNLLEEYYLELEEMFS